MSKHINIGLTKEQKEEMIQKYLSDHTEITKVVYFTADKREPLKIDFEDVEHRTWSDAIMYRYFYPLLEKIDHNTLLIFDEMMRTQKRNDLTYNCCHHYGNQTEHIMVFNWFPLIDNPEDFMILIDFAHPNVYKGQPYTPEYLRLDGVHIVDRMIEIQEHAVYADGKIPEEISAAYEDEKEMLFDNIGNKDPDTIPRTLHIWCGTHCKKDIVNSLDKVFIARNSRFKSDKVRKWTDRTYAGYILDFPVRQLQFNDFCETSGRNVFAFVNSGLSADKYYFRRYTEWTERLGGMYVASSV